MFWGTENNLKFQITESEEEKMLYFQCHTLSSYFFAKVIILDNRLILHLTKVLHNITSSDF